MNFFLLLYHKIRKFIRKYCVDILGIFPFSRGGVLRYPNFNVIRIGFIRIEYGLNPHLKCGYLLGFSAFPHFKCGCLNTPNFWIRIQYILNTDYDVLILRLWKSTIWLNKSLNFCCFLELSSISSHLMNLKIRLNAKAIFVKQLCTFLVFFRWA